MRAPETLRPAPIGTAGARNNLLLARDLLSPSSPYSPITPSSTVAFGFKTFKRTSSDTKGAQTRDTDIANDGFKLSAPPTPTSISSGAGVLVKLSDGSLAVKTLRKTLRIAEDTDKDVNQKGKASDTLAEGDAVTFDTDGSKAHSVKKQEV